MGRIYDYIKRTQVNIRTLLARFPVVLVFLAFIAVLNSFLLENRYPDDVQTITRIIFSALFGVFLNTAFQFLLERFVYLMRYKWIIRTAAVILSVLYYFFLTSPGKTDGYMLIRLIVICFALFAFLLWIPSFRENHTFSANALIHFKACFISVLYSLVLILGLIAIYFAVDRLLFNLDDDIPAHIFNIVGTFFFPLYYLSLLPDFNSAVAGMTQRRKTLAYYPRFLEILVSYIAIPLITIFTVVLAAYFIKIIVTMKWPVGELGPMILGYSAAGLFICILGGRLDNRFAVSCRLYFTYALIPLVGLQLYSVFIRINAFGITESRYYLVLFGIYSVACALFLIITKGTKPGYITLLAACFAIFSIIPPADAFTVSRSSQAARIESILNRNGMLSGNIIKPRSDISDNDKAELTNIMNYMYQMGHTQRLQWLPGDYKHYEDFSKVFGFTEYYKPYGEPGGQPGTEMPNPYLYASIDPQYPIDIKGYDVMLKTGFFNTFGGGLNRIGFVLDGEKYTLEFEYPKRDDMVFRILDSKGAEQAAVSLKPFVLRLMKEGNISGKSIFTPGDLTFDADNRNFKIRIVMNSIGFKKTVEDSFEELSGEALVLIGRK